MLGLGWRPFNQAEEHQIVSSIVEAEKLTSGEIKVHVDKWCKTDPVYKAQNVFHHLKMDETQARNGVLIYVALKEHKISIIGDVGIHELVGPGFWNNTMDHMLQEIKSKGVVEGICAGIDDAAKLLATHFPAKDDDKDELSNDISYG